MADSRVWEQKKLKAEIAGRILAQTWSLAENRWITGEEMATEPYIKGPDYVQDALALAEMILNGVENDGL